MSSPTLDAPEHRGNHIDGAIRNALSAATYETVNPTTGEAGAAYPDSGPEDVDSAVRAAHRAFVSGPWASLSPTRRGRLMMRWAEAIADNAEKIGAIETRQNGKLFVEARSQALAVRDWLYYFGGLADKVEGRVIPLERPSVFNYTLREPLGVVGVIVPWNSPCFITIMACAPALAAGNTIVIKPSEVTPGSALELVRLAEEAGIPPGVLNVVTGGLAAGEALVSHELVRKINFTGGEAGGRAVAARAASRLATSVLELGGKSANIVFADADLDRAEAGVLAGVFAAAGQTCVAGSRVLVHSSICDELTKRLVRRARGIVIGNPMKRETQVGPVSTKAQLERDEMMVRRAVQEGAELLCGGKRLHPTETPNGFFFEPTILRGCSATDFVMQNEVFGPVVSLTPFETDQEAAELANGTRYGLAAGVWTKDLSRAHTMARALRSGTVWINTYRALAFNSPFGGYNASGTGRQNGIEAIDQYLQTKSVWCDLGTSVDDPFVIRT